MVLKCGKAEYHKGKPPTGGIDFAVKLQMLFGLTFVHYFRETNWRLSNENLDAGKFDDLVIESDAGDILLQSKRKDNPSNINQNNFMSSATDHTEFCLVKYILTYKTISTFKIKHLILCSNCGINQDNALFNKVIIDDYDIIKKIFNTTTDIYIVKKSYLDIFSNLVTVYQNKLSADNKWKNLTINTSDIEAFFNIFLFVKIKDDILDSNIKSKLEVIKREFNFPISTYEYILDQIRKWFNSTKSITYMNNDYIKSILYGDFNQKLSKNYANENMKFKPYFLSDPPSQIVHIKPGPIYKLYFMKIQQTIEQYYKHKGKPKYLISEQVLFLNSDLPDTLNIIRRDFLDCFSVKKYKLMVVSLLDLTSRRDIRTICDRIAKIIKNKPNKIVVIVSHQVDFHGINNIHSIIDNIGLDSLEKESRERFLRKQLIFQGESIPLNQFKNVDINEFTITALIHNNNYVLGLPIRSLGDLSSYYITRKLKRADGKILNESDLLNVDVQRFTVIADLPGSGKSTLVTKIANDIKKKSPSFWIVMLKLQFIRENIFYLAECTHLLNYLYLHENVNNEFEMTFLKCLPKIIILDSIEELNQQERNQLITFIINKISPDIVKVFIATRSVSTITNDPESTKHFEILNMEPFQQSEEHDFILKYFNHNYKQHLTLKHLEDFFVLTTEIQRHLIYKSPLFLKLIADIYSNKVGDKCLKTTVYNINVYELYKMFLARKKEDFLKNSGNVVLHGIIEKGFDKNLEELQIFAVKRTFNQSILKFLDIDNQKHYANGSVDKVGIVCNMNNETVFIHKTFEEYFIAEYLWAFLLRHKRNLLAIKDTLVAILDEILLGQQFLGVSQFFSALLETKLSKYSREISDLSNVYSILLNRIDWNHKNLVHLAGQNCLYVIKLLLDNFKYCYRIVNRVDQNTSMTALRAAAMKCSFPIMEYLIRKGANVVDVCGEIITSCPTIYIKTNRFKEIIGSTENLKFITQHYDIISNKGEQDIIDLLKFLIASGADVKASNKEGCSIVHYAALRNFPTILKYLHEELNFPLDESNNFGMKPIHFAAMNDSFDVIDYFIQNGCNIYEKNNMGINILHIAASRNSIPLVRYLVEDIRMNINCTNNHGFYPLHTAALCDAVDVIRYLKNKNVRLNLRTRHGSTIAHIAAGANSLPVMKFLIEEVALRMNITDYRGSFPQHIAAQFDAIDIIKYFNRRGVNLNVKNKYKPFCSVAHIAAQKNSLNTMKFLVEECGINVNVIDNDGSYIQHYAAAGNALEVVKYVHSKGFNLNVSTKTGVTILHTASLNNSLKVVKFLIENCNANVNVCDSNGYFPQHYAAKHNALDVVKYLKYRNFNFNLETSLGFTPVHLAASTNSINTMRYLIEDCGLNINVIDNYGNTPYDVAVLHEAHDVINYIYRQNINRILKTMAYVILVMFGFCGICFRFAKTRD